MFKKKDKKKKGEEGLSVFEQNLEEFKSLRKNVSALDEALKKYEKTLDTLGKPLTQLASAITATFTAGDLDEDKALVFSQSADSVQDSLNQYTADQEGLRHELSDIMGNLSKMKKEIQERDDLNDDYMAKDKLYKAALKKEKDQSKIDHAKEKLESAKELFESKHDIVLEDLGILLSSSYSTIDRLYDSLVEAQIELFSKITKNFGASVDTSSYKRTLPPKAEVDHSSDDAPPTISRRDPNIVVDAPPPSIRRDPPTVVRDAPAVVREIPPQVVRNDPPPVVRNDPPPVTRENPPPVVRNDPPVTRENPPPVVRNDPPPVVRNDPPPVTRENPPPVTRENPPPVVRNDPPPVVRNDPPPLVRNDPDQAEEPLSFIAEKEKAKYAKIFKREDKENTGFITGEAAFNLFTRSKLDTENLALIWELADQDVDGNLDVMEFTLAMYLINGKLKGELEIPTGLPDNFIIKR